MMEKAENEGAHVKKLVADAKPDLREATGNIYRSAIERYDAKVLAAELARATGRN